MRLFPLVACVAVVGCTPVILSPAPPPLAVEPPAPKAAFLGAIDEVSAATAYQDLVKLADTKQAPLYLVINSPGGEILAGFRLIQAIESLKKTRGVKLLCVGDGLVASMAAVIYESGVCDERLATKRTAFLFHKTVRSPDTTPEDEKFMVALDHIMAEIVAPRLNATPEQYLEGIANGDIILLWHEAQGTVFDRTIEPEAVPAFVD